MYIADSEDKFFEFSSKGKTYRLITPDSMPTPKMYEYVEAAEGGTRSLMRWLADFFNEQTGSKVADQMKFSDFAALARKWQESGNAELGESQASSD